MGASQEEVVKEFVRELQSILESRPPISKAKMMSITKSALKAVKFYKHVVMNVEKFIMKCKPEYKIPGLYVIDSVIRQSRHQYGTEKDVFGARFAKNILTTLQNVEKCPPDDRNKISRVLNLWEKNAIFPSDVLQQLFQAHQGIANPDEPSIDPTISDKTSASHEMERFRELQETLKRAAVKPGSDTTSILTEIQQITSQLLESQKKTSVTSTAVDEPSSTTASIGPSTEPIQSNFDHVLGDFDYDSDKDDEEPRVSAAPAITTTASTLTTTSALPLPPQPTQFFQPPPAALLNNSNPMGFPLNPPNHIPMSIPFDPTRPPPIFYQQLLPTSLSNPSVQAPAQVQQAMTNYDDQRRLVQPPIDVDLRPEDMDDDNDDDQHHYSHRSPSPARHYYNRRRSRSRSPSRDSKRTRSSSGSMSRRDSAASRIKETERRERRRKGLPPLKEDHLVVSSRTLWLGHLPKMISESDLREQLEPHGEITEISIIPPRGCAFICFKERSDAARCLDKMKDARFHGNHIKIAWAMNKGVKNKYKDYWDVDHGCTYIPYSELKDIPNLNALAEEGTIDEESLPPYLKPMMKVDAPLLVQQPSVTAAVPPPPPPPAAPIMSTQPTFVHPEYPPNAVPLQSPNRLPPGSTILLATSQESPIRVGLPVQMMPPGAQIIQVQPHPHGQPVQVVQRFPGRVFPNGQIIHQMPFTPVLAATQHPQSIQIQHHPADFKDRQGAPLGPGGGLHLVTNATAVPTHHHFLAPASVTTGATLTSATFAHTLEGPTLVQFHNDPHRHLRPPSAGSHFDAHHQATLPSTDEQLLRLSNSSTSANFPSQFSSQPPPSLLGHPPSPSHQHQQAPPSSSGLLPIPTVNDEHPKPTNFPRRPNRFEAREESPAVPETNTNFGDFRSGRHSFNDLGNPAGIPRGGPAMNRERGRGYPNGNRGYYNNADRGARSDNNDSDNGGYRNRGGFNRPGRGSGGGPNSRFNTRGSNYRNSNYDQSSTRRSSRSPDRYGSSSSSSHRHDHHTDRYSSRQYSSGSTERPLSSETLRKRDQSDDTNNNFNQSSLTIDETA